MILQRWSRRDDGLWDLSGLAADGGETATTTDVPAIGYCQAPLGDGTWDVVVLATGSAQDMETWRTDTKSRLDGDDALRTMLGGPRVVSGSEWTEEDLNAALTAPGLWRLLRREGLL